MGIPYVIHEGPWVELFMLIIMHEPYESSILEISSIIESLISEVVQFRVLSLIYGYWKP